MRGVSVSLGGNTVLQDINADISCGEITSIIGPNGAGKTTLISAILGLVPYRGEITFCRRSEHGAGNPRVHVVPQQLDFDRGTPLTVSEFLCLSIQKRPLWLGSACGARRRAVSYLERVEAAHLASRALGVLSGGEFQRVMLALALMPTPDILILDEPISGVDVAGEELFCEILDRLKQESGFTLILVSHDLHIVTRHADRVICLNKTVQCEGRAVEVLTPENLRAVFGIHTGLYSHSGKLEAHDHGNGHG
jgi:zinc transport system ATP-binding protein